MKQILSKTVYTHFYSRLANKPYKTFLFWWKLHLTQILKSQIIISSIPSVKQWHHWVQILLTSEETRFRGNILWSLLGRNVLRESKENGLELTKKRLFLFGLGLFIFKNKLNQLNKEFSYFKIHSP